MEEVGVSKDALKRVISKMDSEVNIQQLEALDSDEFRALICSSLVKNELMSAEHLGVIAELNQFFEEILKELIYIQTDMDIDVKDESYHKILNVFRVIQAIPTLNNSIALSRFRNKNSERMSGLTEIVTKKKNAKKIIASYVDKLIEGDVNKELRTTLIAKMAWGYMAENELLDSRPENFDSFKRGWISPLLPDYCKKGGAPSRN